EGKEKSEALAPLEAAKAKGQFRYVKATRDERYIDASVPLYFKMYSEVDKSSSYFSSTVPFTKQGYENISNYGVYSVNGFLRAENADTYLFTKENYETSANLYVTSHTI